MKVLMIAPTPFFSDRGCHTQIYEEIRALQKLGCTIRIVTYGLGRDIGDIDIRRTINFPWYKKVSAGPSKTKILLLPFLTMKVIQQIILFKPVIIHAHLHEGALIARFCKWFFPRKKYLFDMQGSLTGETLQHGFVKENSFFYRLLLWLEKRIANWFFVITQSDTMMAELQAFGVPEHRRRNVHDGVDTEIFRPMPFNESLALSLGIDPVRPRILYMGLLEQYQGADLMFEAFGYVAKAKPETQFIIIGFPNIDKYKMQCDRSGILSNTFFLGKIDYTKLPEYLTLAPIAVAPKISPTEGDGKIYNYMAMGMLTVAFDRSVSREILGDTGVFADFADAHKLADKLIRAIDHPQETVRLGQLARERAVTNLSWDAVGQRIFEVYNNL